MTTFNNSNRKLFDESHIRSIKLDMNMSKMTLPLSVIIFFFGFLNQVSSECFSPYLIDNNTNLCYYHNNISLSWSDSHTVCLNQSDHGILIELSSINYLKLIENKNIFTNDIYWVGANNFGLDSKWRWLDDSTINQSFISWCSNSTYKTTIGVYCVAYNTNFKCLDNYLCSTSLPAACVSGFNQIENLKSINVNARLSISDSCAYSYATSYANWWTYSLILVNWFIYFCFNLYLSHRFNTNKFITILTIFIIGLSFCLMIAFAVLWGVQYQNLTEIPFATVMLGFAANFLFFINILILVSNREHVQRWKPCMVLTILMTIIENFLMLGIILCIAHCSGFISLASTNIEKDIIASLLAGLNAAISALFTNGILCFLGNANETDRTHARRSVSPMPNNSITPISVQKPTKRPENTHTGNNNKLSVSTKRYDKVERSTSPVDQRVLDEFYRDQPKEKHEYQLDGRQYVVYEGKTFTDIDSFRKELTQAMLLQEPEGLNEAIDRINNSPYSNDLAEDVRQAENLLSRLK